MKNDLLSDAVKARILAGLLMPLQEEEYQLLLLRTANDADGDEMVPGQDFTYTERLNELTDAQERLLSAADETIVNQLRGINGKQWPTSKA